MGATLGLCHNKEVPEGGKTGATQMNEKFRKKKTCKGGQVDDNVGDSLLAIPRRKVNK